MPAGVKQGQAEEKMEPKGNAQRAQDNPKGEMKQKGVNSDIKTPGKTSTDMKTDPKAKVDMKTDAKMPEKAGDAPAKASTTGSSSASGPATLSGEQRTLVRSGIAAQNAQPAKNITFSISIGTAVPRSVHFYRVPTQLVTIYPHWRGYDYFLVGDQIVVVDPRTHQIVAVLEA
jgi:hypothetical protein